MATKVAIIGAGASGLASARRALEYGVEIVVFEASDHIGGIWVYSEEPAGSSSPIYDNLRYRHSIA
jgi:dimethylaniline monooxygenase (N-oxide forming)